MAASANRSRLDDEPFEEWSKLEFGYARGPPHARTRSHKADRWHSRHRDVLDFGFGCWAPADASGRSTRGTSSAPARRATYSNARAIPADRDYVPSRSSGDWHRRSRTDSDRDLARGKDATSKARTGLLGGGAPLQGNGCPGPGCCWLPPRGHGY